jgi:hypothetical protein
LTEYGTEIGAKVHHPITAKRQLWLRLARPGHGKRSGFQLLARACLLSRRITLFCTHTITTAISTNITTIVTTATDHYHRQSFLSLSRPPQQTTAFTNARDASRRGRTDQSHGQPHLSLPLPSQQTTDTTNPGAQANAAEPTNPQSTPSLVSAQCAIDSSKHELR